MRRYRPVNGEYLPRYTPGQVREFIRDSQEQPAEERIAAALELAEYYDLPISVPVARDFEMDAERVELLPDVDGVSIALVHPPPVK